MSTINIRESTPNDAEKMITLYALLDTETKFMLFEPGERKTTAEKEEKQLEKITESDHRAVFVAEDQDRIVGFVSGSRPPFFRTEHRFHIVIGIAKSHWRNGIGFRLMTQIEKWTRDHGAQRLELTVLAKNKPAIALYERCGFETEGIRRDSIKHGDSFEDELSMAKLLS